ncbi:MAG: YcfL family protein [Burkholderiales bacterium]|nr:YcfL family protein [Burkholderiales bacterium]
MKTIVVAAALAALALGAGCASRKGFEREGFAFGCPVADADVDSMGDLIAAKVAPEGKRTNVVVTEMRCTISGERMKIEANLENDAGQIRRVAYKFRWIDTEGMRAADEESWKPVLMYEKSNHVVTAIAPNSKAVDFRLVYMGQD